MAGSYITQSRNTERMKYPSKYKFGASEIGQSDSYPGVAPPKQTTTSWRTSRRADSATDPDLEGQLDALYPKGAHSGAMWDSGKRVASSGDNGHTFDTTKQSFEYGSPVDHLIGSAPYAAYRYDGPVFPDPTYSTLGGQTYASGGVGPDSGYYGPEAIRRTAPTNPHAGLAVGLAELRREGIPHMHGKELIEAKTRRIRETGSEYLNHQFGWLPLLSDVRDAVGSIKKSAKILDDFNRNSGKTMRRKLEFDPITTTQTRETSGARLIPAQQNNAAFRSAFVGNVVSGTLFETLTTRSRVWFSGAYTYHAAVDRNLLDRVKALDQKSNILFGTRVTPEVLWNLAPWSWLADWNMNIGANIANASSLGNDGLVLRYGYLMIESVTSHTSTLTGPTRANGGTGGTWSVTCVTHSKKRIRATPYGFGSNPASYTSKQWAILGALGLTKAPKTLA